MKIKEKTIVAVSIFTSMFSILIMSGFLIVNSFSQETKYNELIHLNLLLSTIPMILVSIIAFIIEIRYRPTFNKESLQKVDLYSLILVYSGSFLEIFSIILFACLSISININLLLFSPIFVWIGAVITILGLVLTIFTRTDDGRDKM